jgi:hypothetical protein
VPVVAYGRTGVSELVRGISGCGVFDRYETDAALSAIQKATDEVFDFARVEQILSERIEVGGFRQRLDEVLAGNSSPATESPLGGSPPSDPSAGHRGKKDLAREVASTGPTDLR